MSSSGLVLILFTDLVDSTRQRSDIGDVAADELRRSHFTGLREALAATGGTEVKTIGDALMATYAGAADALAGAVAMQWSVERHNRRGQGPPQAMRIGVSAGDAAFEDGDWFGTPVIEASRLSAVAEGGQILISDLVWALAGSRTDQEIRPVGARELKGFPEAVAVSEVVWSAAVDQSVLGRPPLPSRLASMTAGSFVGRVAEHELLATAWKAVAGGDRRVMLLAGEPGIGKTTLAARFASEVSEAGATVVYGRCDEDLGIPYQPWIEALTQLVAGVPERVLDDHVAERGAHLARLVPELARRVAMEVPTATGGDAARFVLFGCVADLLERSGEEAPVLVVLDDLHWADRPSVQLLRHVIGAEPSMRVGLLGTFRDSEVTAGHPVGELLAALHREQGVERIGLRGLTDLDLLDLLERIAGHAMTDDGVALRDAVLAETEGNPFFVVEILRHLAETGAIYQDAGGRWTSDVDLRTIGLPVSVKEVIGRRIAALGAETERVLGLAAVIGRDFDLPLLAAVAKIDDDELIGLCDAAVSAAVLQTTSGDQDRYTFAHALIEHTLYDGLSPARRARGHRAVAEQLEAIQGDEPGERTGELAHHWACAVQPSDTVKAIHYATLAGARALDQLAPDEALRWYSQALELLDRDPQCGGRDRAEILVGLGDAQRQCGIAASRETLLDAARIAEQAGATDLIIRSALANHRGFVSAIGAVDRERLAVIDRALELATSPDDADRARLLALACTERMFDAPLEERVRLAEEAVSAARRSGDAAALVDAVGVTYTAVSAPSTLEMRIGWTTEACQAADQLPDPARGTSAHNHRWDVAVEQGDLAELTTQRARLDHEARLSPYATDRWVHTYNGAVMQMLRGDLAEAEAAAEAALTLGTNSGQPDAMTFFAAQLVIIRHHQGRLHEMMPVIEQAIVDLPNLGSYRSVLALAYAHQGDTVRSARLIDDDASHGFTMPEDTSWSTAATCWAEAAARVGHHACARVMRDRMAPFHTQLVTTTVYILPTLAHYLGRVDHLLGRYDDADAWFAEAVRHHTRLESPLLIAYTDAAWAAMLAERDHLDDRTRAREKAQHALAAATTGGYGYIEADARAVLDRIT